MSFATELSLMLATLAPVFVLLALNLYLAANGEEDTLLLPPMA